MATANNSRDFVKVNFGEFFNNLLKVTSLLE